jgi:hypothetical protein
MDSKKISISLFVLIALNLCLMGEVSSQDANENLLYVMYYPQSRLIGQPLAIGPACYELTSQGQAVCESITGCMWTAEAKCRSIPSDSPATVTMQGNCSDNKALTKQCIAEYNADYSRWVCINKCMSKHIGEDMKISCTESDGRVMTWDLDACTISVDLFVRTADFQNPIQQISILNFLFNAIERGNVVIFTLAIAISFAIGLYISEVISKPKSHRSWKKYIKKNDKKVRKSSKSSRKR